MALLANMTGSVDITIPGCTDSLGDNYNPDATTDDGSCEYIATDGIKIYGGLQDKDGQLGGNGQLLSSTGTELNWIDSPADNDTTYDLAVASGTTKIRLSGVVSV